MRYPVVCNQDDTGFQLICCEAIDLCVAVIYTLLAITKRTWCLRTWKNLYSPFQVFTKIGSFFFLHSTHWHIYIYFNKNRHCSLNYALDMQICIPLIKWFHMNIMFISDLYWISRYYNHFILHLSLSFNPSVKELMMLKKTHKNPFTRFSLRKKP